jgi:hypothetical protein
MNADEHRWIQTDGIIVRRLFTGLIARLRRAGKTAVDATRKS